MVAFRFALCPTASIIKDVILDSFEVRSPRVSRSVRRRPVVRKTVPLYRKMKAPRFVPIHLIDLWQSFGKSRQHAPFFAPSHRHSVPMRNAGANNAVCAQASSKLSQPSARYRRCSGQSSRLAHWDHHVHAIHGGSIKTSRLETKSPYLCLIDEYNLVRFIEGVLV